MKRSDSFKLVLLTAAGAAAAAYVLSKAMPSRSRGKESKPAQQRTRDAVRIGIPLARVFRQDEEIMCGDINIRVTGIEHVKAPGDADSTFRILLRLENRGMRPYTYKKEHFQRQDADYDMFDEIGSEGGSRVPVMLRTGEAFDEVLMFKVREGTEGFSLIFMNEHSKPVGIDFVL
jgi:hypothetical protein